MLPMMDPPDVAVLEEAFLRRRGRAVDVLEWGSGGSTVHFPRFLREQGIAFTWNSVEHDDDWFRKVSGAGPESDRYVDFPEGIGRKFWFREDGEVFLYKAHKALRGGRIP